MSILKLNFLVFTIVCWTYKIFVLVYSFNSWQEETFLIFDIVSTILLELRVQVGMIHHINYVTVGTTNKKVQDNYFYFTDWCISGDNETAEEHNVLDQSSLPCLSAPSQNILSVFLTVVALYFTNIFYVCNGIVFFIFDDLRASKQFIFLKVLQSDF